MAWGGQRHGQGQGGLEKGWRGLGDGLAKAWKERLGLDFFHCLQDLWTLEITCEEAKASVENECLQLRISFQSWGPGVDFWHEKCTAIL